MPRPDAAQQDLWPALGLRGNPFRWDPSMAEADPRSWVVGRTEESELLLDGIRAGPSSRQVVSGPTGCGKAALARLVQRKAEQEGFLVGAVPIPITHRLSPEDLLVALLRPLRDAVVRDAPSLPRRHRIMERCQEIIRRQRQREVTALTLARRGREADPRTEQVRTARLSARDVVPELLLQLIELAGEHGDRGRGAVLHLSGMSRLAPYELRASLRVIRQVKEVFEAERVHFLLAGTPDTLHSFRRREFWASRLFVAGVVMEPLPPEDVERLVGRRLELLRIDPRAPVPRPVPAGAAAALAPLFEGDVRAVLVALERLALCGPGSHVHASQGPERTEALARALAPIYAEEAARVLRGAELEFLRRLIRSGRPQLDQESLELLWGVGQARVSNVLSILLRHGYVRRSGTPGRVIQYRPTGAGRLAGLPPD